MEVDTVRLPQSQGLSACEMLQLESRQAYGGSLPAAQDPMASLDGWQQLQHLGLYGAVQHTQQHYALTAAGGVPAPVLGCAADYYGSSGATMPHRPCFGSSTVTGPTGSAAALAFAARGSAGNHLPASACGMPAGDCQPSQSPQLPAQGCAQPCPPFVPGYTAAGAAVPAAVTAGALQLGSALQLAARDTCAHGVQDWGALVVDSAATVLDSGEWNNACAMGADLPAAPAPQWPPCGAQSTLQRCAAELYAEHAGSGTREEAEAGHADLLRMLTAMQGRPLPAPTPLAGQSPLLARELGAAPPALREHLKQELAQHAGWSPLGPGQQHLQSTLPGAPAAWMEPGARADVGAGGSNAAQPAPAASSATPPQGEPQSPAGAAASHGLRAGSHPSKCTTSAPLPGGAASWRSAASGDADADRGAGGEDDQGAGGEEEDDDDTEEGRARKRRASNRDSARRTRQRKLHRLQALEEQVAKLLADNAALTHELTDLRARNTVLLQTIPRLGSECRHVARENETLKVECGRLRTVLVGQLAHFQSLAAAGPLPQAASAAAASLEDVLECAPHAEHGHSRAVHGQPVGSRLADCAGMHDGMGLALAGSCQRSTGRA